MQVDYAEAASTLATAVNDWSAAHAAERTVAVLALQQAVSRCPGAGRSVLTPLVWSAAMTTARLTASPALPAACTAVTPPTLAFAARCTDGAAATMFAAAKSMVTDDAQKAVLQRFVGELHGSALAIRAVFSGAAASASGASGSGGSFACPRPSDFARLNSLVASMILNANHALTIVTGVGATDQVQDAGMCLQAAYYVEMAGIEVLKALIVAETAVATAAASGGNITVAAASTLDEVTMMPFFLSATRLIESSNEMRALHAFAREPVQQRLRAFAQATQSASFVLMETGGNTTALQQTMNTTSTAWAATMAAVATDLARFSNNLMAEHSADAAEARQSALLMIAAPVSEAVALLMLLYTAWLLASRHLNEKAMTLKEAQLQSKNAFVSYV